MERLRSNWIVTADEPSELVDVNLRDAGNLRELPLQRLRH